MPNNLNQAFKDEAVKFAAVEIAPNRETIRTAVLKALRSRLSPYSIRVNDLNIDNIAFSRQFEQAIEAKQEATQAALRAKAQVQQAQFEAQSRVAKAKGEADANVDGRPGPGRGQPQAQRLALGQRAAVHRDPEAQPAAAHRGAAGRHATR